MRTHDVVVAEDVWGPAFDALSRRYTVLSDPELWKEPERLHEALRDARALVVRNRTSVDASLLGSARNLEVVARAGVGLDNIDLAAAQSCGVTVVSPRGANARSVAEYTVGAALALVREFIGQDRAVRAGAWDRRPGRELAGGTWGILGAGSTGLAVARLARELGMSVIGYDPYVDGTHADIAAVGLELTSLETVCDRSDVISIHLPSTPDTDNLIDRRLLKTMRPTAVLVNAARGEVIDETALADALERGELFGAALDVRAVEPPIVSRLERLDNTLLTPHIAGITAQSQLRITQALADDIDSLLSGGVAQHAVTMPVCASDPVPEVSP